MHHEREERFQLIVLGASNVANCTPEIVSIGQATAGPIDLYFAAGHGRSYLNKSSVFWRSLSGIDNCGIWDVVPNLSENAAAIITDIGNDLLYDVPIKTIGSAVKSCIAKLLETTPQVALTGLPVEAVSSLGNKRYLLMRSILFPGNRTSLSETIDRVHRLEEHIDGLAQEFGIRKMEPKGEWFGFDPIHIVRRHRVTAWSYYLQQIGLSHSTDLQIRTPRWLRWQLRFLTHETKWVFGLQRKSRQPTRKLTDGSRVFLF